MQLPDQNNVFSRQGFAFLNNSVPQDRLTDIKADLLAVSKYLGAPKELSTVDDAWNFFKVHDRAKGGLIYNAFKRLPSVHRLSVDESLLDAIKLVTGFTFPSVVDVNCRIDSSGEEKFLFDWHQDYWFSVSSTNAVVVWIPLERIDSGTGGIELFSLESTGDKVFKTTSGTAYNSYADAVKLADALPTGPIIGTTMEPGDALVFKFKVLHRSKPVLSTERSRFTMQLRFVDLADPQFIANEYRPGTVSKANTDYLKRGN